MEKLTNEAIAEKAAALTESKGNTVTPIVITVNDEQVIGYFQEPEYDVLMYVTDCYLNKEISKAAEAVIKNALIAEESDPRILSSERKNAKIRASFTNASLKLVMPFVDEYKKK